MGKDKACEKLAALAAEDDKGQVVLLCRMLFTAKSKSVFREPSFGGICKGAPHPDDWPLFPLEIIDGVPFYIAGPYMVASAPETSAMYLEYCKKDCEWSDVKYKSVTDDTINKSLKSLFNSPKLKAKLSDKVKERFTEQVDKE